MIKDNPESKWDKHLSYQINLTLSYDIQFRVKSSQMIYNIE